tara:strand:+ start:3031 stop:3210 length:180 start_codon:yes stop_codon:yes gene_type:complete
MHTNLIAESIFKEIRSLKTHEPNQATGKGVDIWTPLYTYVYTKESRRLNKELGIVGFGL